MKLLRLLCVSAMVCGLSVSALGNTFHVKVLDPTFYDIETDEPGFTVDFAPCDNDNGGPLNGCFVGHNDTEQTFNSLTLTFNSAALIGVGADCITDVNLSVFGSSDCPSAPTQTGEVTLVFSGSPGITPNEYFTIVESNDDCTDNGPDCITPGEFGDVAALVTLTPEPNPMVLMGTGLFLGCALVMGRRRFAGVAANRGGMNSLGL